MKLPSHRVLLDGITVDRDGNLKGWFKGPDLTPEVLDTALRTVFIGATDLYFEPTTPHQWQRRRRWRRFSAHAVEARGDTPG